MADGFGQAQAVPPEDFGLVLQEPAAQHPAEGDGRRRIGQAFAPRPILKGRVERAGLNLEARSDGAALGQEVFDQGRPGRIATFQNDTSPRAAISSRV